MATWPHAPSKIVTDPGTIIITAATYQKVHFFHDPVGLKLLHDTILKVALEEGWDLLAWAVLRNHYHLVGISPNKPNPVRTLTSKIHTLSASELNKVDDRVGRRNIWYRSWDRNITFERSIMARIAYVTHNPVKHGIVRDAEEYPWCSAAWLREGGEPFFLSVMSFKTDKLDVPDDF